MSCFKFITVLLVAVFATSLDAQTFENNALECTVVQDEYKKIQCTFFTDRQEEQRHVIFSWHSSSTPQDDRERTIVLKAGHASVYDYRYYYGRAAGDWEVSVKDEEENILSSTSLTLP